MSEFWTSQLRERRKEHWCETCGQTVPIGGKSYDERGVVNGDFSSFKQCRACHEIVRYFYWRGTLDETGYMLFELAEIARDEGILWPPLPWPLTHVPTANSVGGGDARRVVVQP